MAEETNDEKIARLESELATEKADKAKVLSESSTEIQKLSGRLAEKETTAKLSAPVVTVGDQRYTVAIPSFHLDGKDYTATELARKENAAIAKRLVDKGSHILQPIV